MQPTYRVTFFQKDLWEGYQARFRSPIPLSVHSRCLAQLGSVLCAFQ